MQFAMACHSAKLGSSVVLKSPTLAVMAITSKVLPTAFTEVKIK